MIYIGLNNINYNNKTIIKHHSKTKLDFNAIAKGYAVDKISKYLFNNNYINHMIEIGGEIYISGLNNGNKWSIGLQDPTEDKNILLSLNIKNKGIATSGTYNNYYEYKNKRYSHLIDPRDGYPIEHKIISLTIIAENCTIADAYATGLIILDLDESIKIIENDPNLDAIFIIENEGNIRYTTIYN